MNISIDTDKDGSFFKMTYSLSDREVVDELLDRLHMRDIILQDNKIVKWVANPYYDDFAEHTHESPGHYSLVSDKPEDVELLKAFNLLKNFLLKKKKPNDFCSNGKIKELNENG